MFSANKRVERKVEDMNSINNAEQSNNVNFKAIKNINIKGYKNNPEKAYEFLSAFKKNPNAQKFINKYDVNIEIGAKKRKSGETVHSFDVRYIDPLVKPKSGIKKVIDKLRTFGKPHLDLFHTHMEFSQIEAHSKEFSKSVQNYFDKNTKVEQKLVKLNSNNEQKFDVAVKGRNINQDLENLEDVIKNPSDYSFLNPDLANYPSLANPENKNGKNGCIIVKLDPIKH